MASYTLLVHSKYCYHSKIFEICSLEIRLSEKSLDAIVLIANFVLLYG